MNKKNKFKCKSKLVSLTKTNEIKFDKNALNFLLA